MGWKGKGKGNNIQLGFTSPYNYYYLTFQPISSSLLLYKRYIVQVGIYCGGIYACVDFVCMCVHNYTCSGVCISVCMWSDTRECMWIGVCMRMYAYGVVFL